MLIKRFGNFLSGKFNKSQFSIEYRSQRRGNISGMSDCVSSVTIFHSEEYISGDVCGQIHSWTTEKSHEAGV